MGDKHVPVLADADNATPITGLAHCGEGKCSEHESAANDRLARCPWRVALARERWCRLGGDCCVRALGGHGNSQLATPFRPRRQRRRPERGHFPPERAARDQRSWQWHRRLEGGSRRTRAPLGDTRTVAPVSGQPRFPARDDPVARRARHDADHGQSRSCARCAARDPQPVATGVTES